MGYNDEDWDHCARFGSDRARRSAAIGHCAAGGCQQIHQPRSNMRLDHWAEGRPQNFCHWCAADLPARRAQAVAWSAGPRARMDFARMGKCAERSRARPDGNARSRRLGSQKVPAGSVAAGRKTFLGRSLAAIDRPGVPQSRSRPRVVLRIAAQRPDAPRHWWRGNQDCNF